MSVTIVCDYCGEAIEGDHAKIHVSGDFAQEKRSKFCSWDFGHYHSGLPDSDEPSCYWHLEDAMKLTQEMGPTLETIETISNQQLAARRRKHTKPAEGDEMTDRERELAELHESVRSVFHRQWCDRAKVLDTIATLLDSGDVDGARELARNTAAACRDAADEIASKRLTRGEA